MAKDDGGLADAAQAAQGGSPGDQGQMDELVLPLVKFVGMSFEGADIENVGLGEEVEFVVRGHVVARTEELMKTGGRRQTRKVLVNTVILK